MKHSCGYLFYDKATPLVTEPPLRKTVFSRSVSTESTVLAHNAMVRVDMNAVVDFRGRGYTVLRLFTVDGDEETLVGEATAGPGEQPQLTQNATWLIDTNDLSDAVQSLWATADEQLRIYLCEQTLAGGEDT